MNVWNNLGPIVRDLATIFRFKTVLLQLMRQEKRSIYGINNRIGIRLLTKLRVDFSDLKLHRFNYRFNCNLLMCLRGLDPRSTEHFFLHSQLYLDMRGFFLQNVENNLM